MNEIIRNPEILSGRPVFRGTRVPVRNLFDGLAGGGTIDEFLEDFPSVSPEQARRVLNDAELAIEARAT